MGIGTHTLGLASILGIVLLSACRSVVPVPAPTSRPSNPDGPVTHQIIFVVHGDGNYLYHDPSGRPHRADDETLRGAFAAAQALRNAEVFVVHLRPKNPFLGLIPRDDGTLYHFLRGTLVDQTTYDQNRVSPFAPEAKWIAANRAARSDSSVTAVFYYGHAVPERPSPGYHRSQPEIPFSVRALSRGLGQLSPSDSLDVTVLSTCDGGTPHTVTALAPYTRHLVAAPGDLHLSYIDPEVAASLSTITDPSAWARKLAARAFERLVDRTVTAVQLAAYDMNETASTARRMARHLPADSSTSPTGGRHVDCQRVLDAPVDTTGVRVWYRAARFGPRADKTQHSGWGCLPHSSTAE